jgi:hypothetical protein
VSNVLFRILLDWLAPFLGACKALPEAWKKFPEQISSPVMNGPTKNEGSI